MQFKEYTYKGYLLFQKKGVEETNILLQILLKSARRFSIYDHLHFSQCLLMAAAILLTLSFDQIGKLLIYVGFGSVFALEKSKIITLHKRSAYCFMIKLYTCTAIEWLYFNSCNNECIMTFPHSLVLDSHHQNFQNCVTFFL